MKYRLLDIVVCPHCKRRKSIIISFIITLILFIGFPFLLVLAHPLVANYLHRELAYRYISNKITENCKDDFEKAVTLNSFIFLNEEQNAPFIDGVDNSPYFDLVRHIGWCDQKAGGLRNLLEKQNIKARIVYFPCHSVTEVWIDDIPRFFDPTFNCYFIYEDNRERIATLEEVLNDNDKLITNNGNSFSKYRGKCITTRGDYRRTNILIDTKPLYKKMVSKIMDCYYWIGGNLFCEVFQDFHFFVMEKFRGAEVVDSLGPIRANERIRHAVIIYDFPKADKIYDNLLNSKDFKDDALFFKAKILLQTKKFGELKEHIINVYDQYGEDITTRTGGNEIRYLFFIERYLEKFYSIENWQLENILNFTEPELKRIYKEYFNKAKNGGGR